MVERLDNLRKVNDEIHRMVTTIPMAKWTLAHDEGRRYGHMTTNIVECINGLFKGVRKLPITGLVQQTFYRCVKYFVERGKEAHAELELGHKFTHRFRKELESMQTRASSYHVRSFNRTGTRFEVVQGHDPINGQSGRVVQVLLDRRQCECGHF